MSIAVITAAMFAIENHQYVHRKHFRLLVAFTVVTFIYDLVFLFFIRDVKAEDAEFDGLHINLNRFAYTFVWISFLFRPIVILVLWRDSLEFRRIIR
jgi:mannose/fructose/N-acetylgalactosamine-specific phosphotransferase system component IIC